MKLLLERSMIKKAPVADPAVGAFLYFGEALPDPSDALHFACEWQGEEPRVNLISHGKREAIALQKSCASLYSFSHDRCGLVYLQKLSAFDPCLPPPGNALVLSFQGWSGGIWHDGPNGRVRGGAWTDLVLPGPAFRLSLEAEEASAIDAGWREEEWAFAWKQSLILALQNSATVNTDTILESTEWSVHTLLNLMLVRLAFPACPLRLLPPDEGWRRLAQNLAVSPMKQGSEGPRFSLDQRWTEQTEAVERMMRWQCAQSPFVPARVLAALALS